LTRWDLQKVLISLRTFEIIDKSEDVKSFPEAEVLPTSLTNLFIISFPNLEYLDKKGLQHLTALKKLSIKNCPKLKCMPEDGLPASLKILNISNCPLLEEEWKRKEGEEWHKVARIPRKYINEDLIE
jgi:hypothetical protein